MHGFKVGWYLDVANQTRRLMWTLAHAHGTVLALVHLAFAATVYMVPTWDKRLRDHASACLMASTVLLPLGFSGYALHSRLPHILWLAGPPAA